MEEATPRDRLTTPGAVALALAAASVLALWLYNSLWVHSAGSPAALDANENAAMLAWLVGWMLLTCAAAAAMVLLVLVVRRVVGRTLPVIDTLALGAVTILIVGAVSLAPLWGTGSV